MPNWQGGRPALSAPISARIVCANVRVVTRETEKDRKASDEDGPRTPGGLVWGVHGGRAEMTNAIALLSAPVRLSAGGFHCRAEALQ